MRFLAFLKPGTWSSKYLGGIHETVEKHCSVLDTCVPIPAVWCSESQTISPEIHVLIHSMKGLDRGSLNSLLLYDWLSWASYRECADPGNAMPFNSNFKSLVTGFHFCSLISFRGVVCLDSHWSFLWNSKTSNETPRDSRYGICLNCFLSDTCGREL